MLKRIVQSSPLPLPSGTLASCISGITGTQNVSSRQNDPLSDSFKLSRDPKLHVTSQAFFPPLEEGTDFESIFLYFYATTSTPQPTPLRLVHVCFSTGLKLRVCPVIISLF